MRACVNVKGGEGVINYNRLAYPVWVPVRRCELSLSLQTHRSTKNEQIGYNVYVYNVYVYKVNVYKVNVYNVYVYNVS